MTERVCPLCRRPMTKELMNKLRTKEQIDEFHITGMCKDCQDNTYGPALGEKEAKRGGDITGSNNWNK